ncbi:MAG: hypothetical protein WC552_00760 [Candidatus Omnitrophota bacterium]
MKIIQWFVLILFLVGCSACAHSFRSYLDDPRLILKDPHYAAYQGKVTAVEHSYLRGQMDYAEYLEARKQIDEDYAKEVQSRDRIIRGEE